MHTTLATVISYAPKQGLDPVTPVGVMFPELSIFRVICGSGIAAGPFITLPELSNFDPWHGQSRLPFAFWN